MFDAQPRERVRVTATGNVGVGTTTPATKLDVAGAIRSDSLVGAGTRIMVTTPDGRINASTNVAGIIVPQIDTVLARDENFITELTNNNTFIENVNDIADSAPWSRTGNSGTNPSRDFLGMRSRILASFWSCCRPLTWRSGEALSTRTFRTSKSSTDSMATMRSRRARSTIRFRAVVKRNAFGVLGRCCSADCRMRT